MKRKREKQNQIAEWVHGLFGDLLYIHARSYHEGQSEFKFLLHLFLQLAFFHAFPLAFVLYCVYIYHLILDMALVLSMT